jgi:amino acid permease
LKRIAALCIALVALVALGLALLGVAPKLVSGCNEALTVPLAAVVIAAVTFGVLAAIAVRMERAAAYLIVLAVPVLVIAQDWYMQQTLPSALALDCPSPLIR